MSSATKNFQSWLIKARKKAKMSYAALARASDLSTATIHGLENSDTSPTLDTVEKLCKALDVSVEGAMSTRSQRANKRHKPVKPAADTVAT